MRRPNTLRQSIVIVDFDRVKSPEYSVGVLHLLKHMKTAGDEMDPNIYLKASAEFLAAALLSGWIIIGFFHPEAIKSNPN